MRWDAFMLWLDTSPIPTIAILGAAVVYFALRLIEDSSWHRDRRENGNGM